MEKTSRRARRTAGTNAAPATTSGGAENPGRPVVAAVTTSTAVRGIRACVAACEAPEVRGALAPLVRAVQRGTRTDRRAEALAAAIACCLDEAGSAGDDRWWVDEAAAWALSRLARARRPAAGTGSYLERLVAEAHVGAAALADRDTRPARFTVVLARLFSDVEACRKLEPPSLTAVGEEIGRLVTADGAVVLADSTAVVDRVDRWTGIREVLESLGGSGWDEEAERRWQAAAEWSLRLLGTRGRRLEAGGAAPKAAPFVAALVDGGGRRARRTARIVRQGKARAGRDGLLKPDHHDAAAATAVMRTGWDRNAVRVLLEWRAAAPRLEIAAGDRLLVAGSWEWAVSCAGRPLDAEGAWSVSAWEADQKAVFLEIAAPLAGGMRLERHVVLLRRQRIVLLADAVVPAAVTGAAMSAGPPAGDIAVRMAVPLAPKLEAEPAAETREVLVYDGAMRFMALPPALPEWRCTGGGGLAVEAGRLVLEQSGQRRLYAPLWLDCEPRRIGRPLTWRQLTVADTRRNLPAYQAAGFRVQAGAEQWLLYRALDVPRNRTLLGCNVSSGFLLGRVKRSGEVTRTVEIE